MRDHSKELVALGLILLSSLVLILFFGTSAGGSRPLIPSLLALAGWEWGLAFAMAQLIFCWNLKDRKAFGVVVGVWVLIIPFILLGGLFRASSSLGGVDRVFTGASCASGLVLGLLVLKGKLDG